jgi:hypothetical protein
MKVRDQVVARPREQGQILALFAIGLLAVVTMVALVLDGGNAFAQQRMTQNGTDAAANAGAVVLAQNLGGATHSDQDVLDTINAVASENEISVLEAEYTDVNGVPIGETVGDNGGGNPPVGASGVAVTAKRDFDTFVARIINLDSFSAITSATAITGFRSGTCTISTGCVLLPVTVPITVLECDGSNDPAPVVPPTHWPTNLVVVLPLCKNGPGNVGWLDWTPTGGGTSELITNIQTPNNPPIDLPSWQYITQTGNVNSKGVEDALRAYDGQVVLFPIFDSTCDSQPTGSGVADCPPGNTGGKGSNQWYHLPEVAAFQMCSPTVSGCGSFTHGAYVNGSNPICDTGNGSTSCLVGKFVNFITEGTVGPISPVPGVPSDIIAIQLIK